MSDPGTPIFVDAEEPIAPFSPMLNTPPPPHPSIAALESAAESMSAGTTKEAQLPSRGPSVTPFATPVVAPSQSVTVAATTAKSPTPVPDPNSIDEILRNQIRKVPLGTKARLAAEAAEKAKKPVEDPFPPQPTEQPINKAIARRLHRKAPLSVSEEFTDANMDLDKILNPRPRDDPTQTAPREAPIPAIAQYPPAPVLADDNKGFALAPGEVYINSKKGYEWVFSEVDFRKASSEFARLLDRNKPITRTKAQRDAGNTIKWKFELVPNEQYPTDLRLRSFKWMNPNSKAKLKVSDLEHDVGDDPPFNQIYDLFFRIIADNAKDFGPGAGLSVQDPNTVANDKRFVARTLGVLMVAEEHSAMEAVARLLEMQYLRLGQRLWDYIRGKPETWINIATRIQSPIIFREAIIHCVGKIDARYQRCDPAQFEGKGPVFKAIQKLILKKLKQLNQLKIKTERDLINYWPMKMYHPHSSDNYIPDRTVYSSEIYLYQARSIWMQYMTNAYHQKLHHEADDGGIRLYRTIVTAGDAYLQPASLQNWSSRFAMSARGLEKLHQALEDVKTEAAEYMQDLTRDNSQGQTNDKVRLGYLTCTWVEDWELPF